MSLPNPRQPRGIPRYGRTLPVPPLRDLTDDELSEAMDAEAETAHAALHGCPVCGDAIGRRCCEFGWDR